MPESGLRRQRPRRSCPLSPLRSCARARAPAERLEPMEKALAEHRLRFARVAREAEAVVGTARKEIYTQRERPAGSSTAARRRSSPRARRRPEPSSTGPRPGSKGSPQARKDRRWAASRSAAPGRGGRLEVPVILPLLDAGTHRRRGAPRETAARSRWWPASSAAPLPRSRRARSATRLRPDRDRVFAQRLRRVRPGADRPRLPISDAEGLRQAVTELSRHATMVSSTYLRGSHESLGGFLEEAGAGFVPYELFALLDPRGGWTRNWRNDSRSLPPTRPPAASLSLPTWWPALSPRSTSVLLPLNSAATTKAAGRARRYPAPISSWRRRRRLPRSSSSPRGRCLHRPRSSSPRSGRRPAASATRAPRVWSPRSAAVDSTRLRSALTTTPSTA